MDHRPATLGVALEALQRHFGFAAFRPMQERVVASVFAGANVLAVLPTGGGKSACFQVPALVRPGLTLVISPLISLMQDQVEAAVARGIPAAFVNSSLDAAAQERVLTEAAAGRVRLLYVAPERLPRLVEELDGRGCRPGLLAVDEAHCISEWGHDFRPAYRRLARARTALGIPQVIALTGSATPAVRDDICSTLVGPGNGEGFERHLASFDRPNLWFGAERVRTDKERLAALLRLLRHGATPAIVYAATRNATESLARVLRYAGLHAAPYHAGLSAARRATTLRRFLDGEFPVIAATCAFGMGIDKPDVRQVIHWTMPATPESYYQEAGRAGRDGAAARCTLLFHPGDPVIHRLQLDVTFPPRPVVEQAWRLPSARARLPAGVQASVERLGREVEGAADAQAWSAIGRRKRDALARLDAVVRYATHGGCRRQRLIGWFGEALTGCSGCDCCEGGTVSVTRYIGSAVSTQSTLFPGRRFHGCFPLLHRAAPPGPRDGPCLRGGARSPGGA